MKRPLFRIEFCHRPRFCLFNAFLAIFPFVLSKRNRLRSYNPFRVPTRHTRPREIYPPAL